MKLKSLLTIALGALLYACDDSLTNIGSSIRPEGDDLTIKSVTYDLNSHTFIADSIYVRTGNPLLGELTDKFFGSVRVDYMAQFYANPGFNFDVINTRDSVLFELDGKIDSLINNTLDSAVLRIYYGSYIGDSISPMAVTAYRVQNKLPRNFYSNVDFTPYVTPYEFLGSAAYTGIDLSISDSLRQSDDYVPFVDIKLRDEVKEQFLAAVRNTPDVFKNQDAFEKFFPGVYLKNTFGDGTILQVLGTEIQFMYRTYHDLQPDGEPLVGHDGKDSSFVAHRVKYISVTPDVIQLNSIQNPIKPNADLLNNDSTTFITSPGGYFTQIDIPVGKILNTLKSDPSAALQFLNGVSLNLKAYEPIENVFSSRPPTYMLLVERAKMNEFFEGNKLPDSKESFLGTYATDTASAYYGYNFGNLNKLVLNFEEEAKKGDAYDDEYVARMAIVPVSAQLDSYGSSILRIANHFLPGAVGLKGGVNPQQTQVVYTLQHN